MKSKEKQAKEKQTLLGSLLQTLYMMNYTDLNILYDGVSDQGLLPYPWLTVGLGVYR